MLRNEAYGMGLAVAGPLPPTGPSMGPPGGRSTVNPEINVFWYRPRIGRPHDDLGLIVPERWSQGISLYLPSLGNTQIGPGMDPHHPIIGLTSKRPFYLKTKKIFQEKNAQL
jgi:hypothetical protein